MKRVFLLLLFIPVFSFAQQNDWAPISVNSKYNYKLDTASYITNTIWVDSVDISGSDSVFYLNRIVKRNNACDSILELAQTMGPLNDAYCNLCRAWKNQPQFLQRKIYKHQNGIYSFHDTLNFSIHSLAQINETWLFDSLNSITATIITTDTITLFGNIDSLKIILLSNGDLVKISKEHGILQFPDFSSQGSYYELVGMENPDLGEIVPGFLEMYNY